MKKYIAEFLGTFALTLAVAGSLAVNGSIPTALVAGITLGLFVYTIGRLSGAHINPAVTIGAWTLKKISKQNASAYILSQFAGASLAVILLGLAKVSLPVTANAWNDFSLIIFISEIVGTIIFTFGIASVVLSKEAGSSTSDSGSLTSSILAPFIIGGSLAIGIILASGLGGNGALNPAVAFGIGSLNLEYLLGPIIGSIAGMWLFKKLVCDCNKDVSTGKCDCLNCDC